MEKATWLTIAPERNQEVLTQEGGGVKEETERGIVRRYNCGKRGHMEMHCPNKALFCEGECGGAATRKGKVEGREVEDIVLDTDCSRTMVKRGLVFQNDVVQGRGRLQSTHYRAARVPMNPLPVMAEPFERIAMDIMGPLPRS